MSYATMDQWARLSALGYPPNERPHPVDALQWLWEHKDLHYQRVHTGMWSAWIPLEGGTKGYRTAGELLDAALDLVEKAKAHA